MPFDHPGLNVLVLALAVGGAVYAARPREISPTACLYAGLGVLLAASATLRAAEWVMALNLLGALILAGLAAADSTTWRDVLLAPFGYLRRVPAVPAFLAGGLPTSRRGLVPVLRVTGLVAVLLVVFGTLFVSADQAFADLLDRVVPDWDLGEVPVRAVVFVLRLTIGVGVAGIAGRRAVRGGLQRDPRAEDRPAGMDRRPGGPRPALRGVRGGPAAVPFGGHDHVLRTAGLTYAEYAREGFFQLLGVGVLTLGVVAAGAGLGALDRPGDRRRFKLLAGVLCLLTLVVLASALHRLGLYEEAFGFTQERLMVHGIIWWLGAVFVLVGVAGAAWRGAWLPRTVVALTGTALLVFTLANPDALVASRNVERHSRTGSLDVDYLGAAMSADAVPALLELPQPYRSCVLRPVATRLGDDEGWAEFNLARRRARTLLEGLPGPTTPCPLEVP